MKKALIVLSLVLFAVVVAAGHSLAQDKAKPAQDTAKPAAAQQKAPRANFGVLTGKVTKIDTADPNNLKMEVVNEADNTTHIVSITPWTNVTKLTDISDIKAGDSVRVMSRKIDNKEVAMGIMFGKIRRTTPPPPTAAASQQPQPEQPKQ